jgi:hypothetical protein
MISPLANAFSRLNKKLSRIRDVHGFLAGLAELSCRATCYGFQLQAYWEESDKGSCRIRGQ